MFFSVTSTMKLKELVADQPKGPLDGYRKRASFNWKSMKLNFYGEECLEYRNKLYRLMESSEVFKPPATRLTLDETRRRLFAQMKLLVANDFAVPDTTAKFNVMFAYDGSLPIVAGLTFGMVPGVLIALGTERHMPYIQKFLTGEFRGGFALTETGHGSNVKGMRTIANYDAQSQSYILNTPDFEAAKFWVGCLGKLATHAVIFAQLITPDNVNHGLNVFIVQVRDPETMLPMNGVTVGDIGEKVGLNGIDNGFVMFKNYRIPRECLLDKMGDVTPDGKFVPVIKDPSKRFGASLGALSMGRVNITNITSNYLSAAVTIALRYCSVRKQFGPREGPELPVIEYQAVNARLMPMVATTFAVNLFSMNFIDQTLEFRGKMFGSSGNKDDLALEGLEIHALSSATKPLCSWLVRDIIQDCREACGGHGYLKAARLGDLRNDNDANCTYEGENNVLLQQTSNWLLSQWPKFVSGKPIASPLGSAEFLSNGKNILQRRFTAKTVDEAMNLDKLSETFDWLVCHFLDSTQRHFEGSKSRGVDDWHARNDSQMFFARSLALVYAERAVFKNLQRELSDPKWKPEERAVLTKLCSLFGAWLLEKRLGDLYSGGYASIDSHLSEFLRQGIVEISRHLVDEAMALVDVFAPPDVVLNSALGMADGKVYEHMKDSIFNRKENLERPSWWREMLSSKL